jgi:type I restriction enzyme S subunit
MSEELQRGAGGVMKLPDGWTSARLSDLGTWTGGGTPTTTKAEFWTDGTIPWVSPKDMKQRRISKAQDSITEDALDSSATNLIPENSVLLVTRSGILRHSLPVATNTQPVTLNQDMKALTPIEGVDSDYLYLAFRRFEREILHGCCKGGTTVQSVEASRLMAFEFPIAPTAEQRRIVAKIEELFSELDEGIENLKQARTQLIVYRQALLKHAFEGKLTADWRAAHTDQLESANRLLARIRAEREARYQQQLAEWQAAVHAWEAEGQKGSKPSRPRKPAEIAPLTEEEQSGLPLLPSGWTWTRLGHTNVDVFDGPFGSNLKTSDYVGAGIRVIRLENIGVLQFNEEKESFITGKKYGELRDHTVFPGDIVFSSFVTERTRVAIVPTSIEKAVNKADCFCVRCYGTTLRNHYVCVFLSTRFAYKQLEAVIHGVGRPRINTTQLKELLIPICSFAEQNVVMEKVDDQFSILNEMESDIDANLQKAEALRQSILKKAFAGELVPQDPADEPAAVLLARVRAERAVASSAKPVRTRGRPSASAPSA